MGREKRVAPGAGTGDHAKERHKRDRKGNVIDWSAPLPPGLVARPEQPRVSSKHKSWFEFIENKDKKKKLELEYTEKKEAPPGFEFVPIGNPALTTACKELSREQDAMVFIVTSIHGLSKRLSSHLNRIGHHVRQTIVEQARATLGDEGLGAVGAAPGLPEPIPEKQEDINAQADAAIRDLFPRVPNTDRQSIIEHAFNKSRPVGKDGPPVGLASDITLSRRVQLAVLAHIRHNHTRYDQLLRETTYVNARKAVESLCLDILVKWRGDEETGRDQLDEILCEVIVISDSESDESDDEDDEAEEEDGSAASSAVSSSVDGGAPLGRLMQEEPALTPALATDLSYREGLRANHAPRKVAKPSRKDRRAAKWHQRGFGRYQAARDQAWHQAVERQRVDTHATMASAEPITSDRLSSHRQQLRSIGEPNRADLPVSVSADQAEPLYHARDPYATSQRFVDVPCGQGHRTEGIQHAHPPDTHRIPQHILAPAGDQGGVSGSIVGSRAPAHGAPEVEWVGHRGQDLKDYLVPSIEPASPEPPRPVRRLPVSYRPLEPSIFHDDQTLVHGAARNPAGPPPTFHPANDGRGDFSEEGFIRLPPRSDPNRAPVAPEQRHEEPFILLNPQHVRPTEGHQATLAAPRVLSTQYRSSRPENAESYGYRNFGERAQPAWPASDGPIPRSEAHPIIIRDYPPPSMQPRMGPLYTLPGGGRPSPTMYAEAHQAGLRRVDDRDRHHVETSIDQRIETLGGDLVEIVRVSNTFPRKHEPHQTQLDPSRYSLRSGMPQQRVVHQADSGIVSHDPRQIPGPGQRFERVVGRVEVPMAVDENTPFVVHHPQGYSRTTREAETGYGRPYPGVETRVYEDGGPLYETRHPTYRSRSRSMMPAAYSTQQYPPGSGRPTPRRDDVILLD
ncbi:uncharacterized protein C8A04DRAFT_15505 [Dichotomopilus funicola]|uniref:DUF2293 domain-containing protein n=1 Tax=Dichotomopilus funicola TaxID=1934379 RepID=A0AAN6UVP0_9PEZI|nr:hypothetical protein C8A04DRAFT_15505 [Dichotomopilus funicola]